MKRILTTLQQKWPEYLLEILVIVIGIYGAFLLDNWNESKLEFAREQKVLVEILENLKEDLVQLNQAEKQLSGSVESIVVLSSSSVETITDDSLSLHLALFANFYKYYSVDNAYQALKSTGIAIKNNELRNAISRYYEYDQERTASGLKDVELQFVNYLIPFLRKHVKEHVWLETSLPKYRDDNFYNDLRTELISAKDNFEQSLVALRKFIARNEQLQKLIELELTD